MTFLSPHIKAEGSRVVVPIGVLPSLAKGGGGEGVIFTVMEAWMGLSTACPGRGYSAVCELPSILPAGIYVVLVRYLNNLSHSYDAVRTASLL
jgi:hypothetical protein